MDVRRGLWRGHSAQASGGPLCQPDGRGRAATMTREEAWKEACGEGTDRSQAWAKGRPLRSLGLPMPSSERRAGPSVESILTLCWRRPDLPAPPRHHFLHPVVGPVNIAGAACICRSFNNGGWVAGGLGQRHRRDPGRISQHAFCRCQPLIHQPGWDRSIAIPPANGHRDHTAA